MMGVLGPIIFLVGVALIFVHSALAIAFWAVALVLIAIGTVVKGAIEAGQQKAKRDAYTRKLLAGEVPFSHESPADYPDD